MVQELQGAEIAGMIPVDHMQAGRNKELLLGWLVIVEEWEWGDRKFWWCLL